MKIPTTIVTGSLGAGKTTIILNAIEQLPQDYNSVWLKNEYGDVNIDSELARLQNIQTTEVLNGCICCVLVGKLEEALKEIAQKYNPDRLIIETAGTAYPYPIIQRINKVEKLSVDGVINVVDALNYKEFLDDSYLGKKESKYVDVVIINKFGLIDDQQQYEVTEAVSGIYRGSQIVSTIDGKVDKDILFGIDSSLVIDDHIEDPEEEHEHNHDHDDGEERLHVHHLDEVEVFSFESEKLNLQKLQELLESLNPKKYFRIKGIVVDEKAYLLNYVLGRITIEELSGYSGSTRLTFMGKHIESEKYEVISTLQAF